MRETETQEIHTNERQARLTKSISTGAAVHVKMGFMFLALVPSPPVCGGRGRRRLLGLDIRQSPGLQASPSQL